MGAVNDRRSRGSVSETGLALAGSVYGAFQCSCRGRMAFDGQDSNSVANAFRAVPAYTGARRKVVSLTLKFFSALSLYRDARDVLPRRSTNYVNCGRGELN